VASTAGRIIQEFTVRNNRLGVVRFEEESGDVNRPVFLDMVPDAHVGDYVRVHVGFALERIRVEEGKP
jgi:hydrogenase maturation factor